MRFTLVTVAAVLPHLTTISATPTDRLADFTKIGLTRLGSLTTDGAVDVSRLKSSLDYTANKIRRGIFAYERNTGLKHSLAAATGAGPAKRKTGSTALTDDNGSLWFGQISVGTPPRAYTVDFDTGSSDLFLPGPDCVENCQGHMTYNPATSSTAQDRGKSFSLAYGDGSTVSGRQYSDTIYLAGLKATKQALGAASQYSSGFAVSQFPADGLMGMAFPSISEYNANPVFQTFVAQRQTSQPVFAFKLATSGAELDVGGLNPRLYSGPVTYVPVTQEGYWQVTMDNVKVAGRTGVPRRTAIIDTGTTLIVGDSTSVRNFYKLIPGAMDARNAIGDGFYTVPCNAIPPISLTFGGRAFSISPNTFNLGTIDNARNCVGGLVGMDIGSQFWIIGDVFLQNTYTVFDVGQKRVGFANLA